MPPIAEPLAFAESKTLPKPAFHDPKHDITIYQGDCLDILAALPEGHVDLISADPPYFLSNGGITCHAGRMVSVNKGPWDRSQGPDANHEFNRAWLAACQRVREEKRFGKHPTQKPLALLDRILRFLRPRRPCPRPV